MDSKVVPCITLEELIAENRIQKYTLVSDIEGSEIEFLMEEGEALRGCQMMIIELHRGVYEGQQLEVADLRRIIVEKLNFKVVQEHGPFAFTQEFDQRSVSDPIMLYFWFWSFTPSRKGYQSKKFAMKQA